MKLLYGLILNTILLHAAWPDGNLGLPPLTIPADNPQTPKKVALGHRLFNDQRLSSNQSVSCASCHRPDRAFTDGLPVARGVNDQRGTRNTPTVINAAFFNSFFWDGRADNLETQALGPLLNPIEHGLDNHQQIITVVRRDRDYRKRFNRVFGIDGNAIEISHITQALAAYERSLVAGDSAFDRYYFGRDRSRLSESAARGLQLFRRKGNCANCHEISWNNALFTDNRYYNIGIGFQRLDPVLKRLTKQVQNGAALDTLKLTAWQRSELGRFNVTHAAADIGKFKTPSLRNIALTAPYMHDGSKATLAEVIEYYNQGGRHNPWLDAAMYPLHLTDQEKADLEAFLLSLTSSE